MERLRCGVVYTQEFVAFLEKWWQAQPQLHDAKIPSLDFVHCRSGERAGESWAALTWRSVRNLPEQELFEIAPVRVPRRVRIGCPGNAGDAGAGFDEPSRANSTLWP